MPPDYISQRKMEQRSTLGYAVLRCISIPVICSKLSRLKVISLDLYKVIIPSFYLPCGTKFLLVVIFAIFAGFWTIRKKINSPKKKSYRKITPLSKLLANCITVFMSYKIVLVPSKKVSFIPKQKEMRNRTFRNKTMKLKSETQQGRSY